MFIIPYHDDNIQGEQDEKRLIDDTIEGLFAQTDEDWSAIIVVDRSPRKKVRDYLGHIKQKYHAKIEIIFLERDIGAGVSRNVGIIKAIERGCSIILFNDADDISHPKRVEVVKRIFLEKPEVDVIYSTFEVINENNSHRIRTKKY
jgi:glycosyltransferase involved in cell wall biosynthesis